MCGRFTLTADINTLEATFPWLNIPEQHTPRYNIAPTQPIAVVPNDGKNRLDYFIWGLIPSWAKDPSIGSRMINARAETVHEKPSFRSAFKRRRCLILADGFYEWRKIKPERGKEYKVPTYIKLNSGQPFAFAGLWEDWHNGDGSQILSCTIITTRPNAMMADIHNRMPVILAEKDYSTWLQSHEAEPEPLKALLVPYPADQMKAYPVSTTVNNPVNDIPACIQPLTA
jgi:putative SOS response-associated peptidase YedK